MNDDERELIEELLDGHIASLKSVIFSDCILSGRLDRILQGELEVAEHIKANLSPKAPDPELERLLQEEEEIDAYHTFLREVNRHVAEPVDISFQAWRNSPLNTVRKPSN